MIRTNLTRLAALAVVVSTLGAPLASHAGDSTAAPAKPPATLAAVQGAVRQIGEEARTHLQAQPDASGALRAVVMKVKGRVQWRPDEKRPWKSAQVDDVLEPGSRIRSGRASQMVLRVGHNATIMVESHTRLALPRVLREGQTLRTVVEVSRGRADIKVDRVGLTNDFSVVTPSGTLAVRGTGFAVEYGGFEGTQIHAARFNEIASIEVTYFVSRIALAISARAISSDRHPNPAVGQLFKGFGPPRLISALLESDATPELLMATMGNQVRRGRRRDLAMMGVDETIEGFQQPYMIDPFFLQQLDDPLSFGEVADFVCHALNGVFVQYAMLLSLDDLGAEGLPATQQQIHDLCANHIGPYGDEDLQEIADVIVSYCIGQHAPSQHDVDRCIGDFYKAVVDEYNNTH